MNKGTRKSYPCDLCGSSFSYQWRCKFHIQNVHAKSRNDTVCIICKRRMSTKSALKVHMARVHSKERRRNCVICSKSFHTGEEIREHMRRVHGDKKFECGNCRRQFIHKRNHKNHETICMANGLHRAHQCSLCPKQYRSQGALQNHVTAKHSGVEFICEMCGKSFTRKYSYTRHVKNVH